MRSNKEKRLPLFIFLLLVAVLLIGTYTSIATLLLGISGETRSELIRYMAFFPRINKPNMLVDPDEIGSGGILYHIFVPILATGLLILIGRYQLSRRK